MSRRSMITNVLIGIKPHRQMELRVQMRTLSKNARAARSRRSVERLASTTGFIGTSIP
jgi:hypothetical protein